MEPRWTTHPGQSRSGRAGSESCVPGRRRPGPKRRQRESGLRGLSSEITYSNVAPTACCSTAGSTEMPVLRGHRGPPESVARGKLSKGFPRNLGQTSSFPWSESGRVWVRLTKRNLALPIRDADGCGRYERRHLTGYLLAEGQPQAGRDERGGGLRTRSTEEGGELQGSQHWGGHRTHWREGVNGSAHWLGETWRPQEVE